MAGMSLALMAGGTGRRRASTFSRSRDTRTASSLNANWLPRDARSVILLNAKSPEIVEAQLPLLMTMKPSFERLVGSLPRSWTMKLSNLAGPYDTSCSISTGSHESLSGLLLGYQVAILRSLAGLPGSRIHPDPGPGARHNMSPPPCPPPKGWGNTCRAHAHIPVLILTHRCSSHGGQLTCPSSSPITTEVTNV